MQTRILSESHLIWGSLVPKPQDYIGCPFPSLKHPDIILVMVRGRENKYNVTGLFEQEDTNTLNICLLWLLLPLHPRRKKFTRNSSGDRDWLAVHCIRFLSSWTIFPNFLAFQCSHVSEFWPKKCGWRQYIPFSGLVQRDPSCPILYAVFFSTVILETV